MTKAEKEILSDAIETCIELEKENKIQYRFIMVLSLIIFILANIIFFGG